MLFANDYNDNRIHIDETHSNQRTYARSDIPCRKVGGRNKGRSAGRTSHVMMTREPWECFIEG